MTFYEAALRVLESAGHPLHFLEITEKSVAQNLLSHVGKTPEQTMLSRLAAMARRNRDRRMIVTAKDTFALVEWGLPEDAAALAVTGVVEPNPEEDLPPLRPVERHPEPRADNLRGGARAERRGREEDEDRDRDRRRRRRFPPVSEVAFEMLTEAASALAPAELLAKAKERSLCGEDLDEKSLLTFLLEDNQRRIDAGRKPQFAWLSDDRQLSLQRSAAASGLSPVEIQTALATVLGISMESGRPQLRAPSAEVAGEGAAFVALKQAVKDGRRAMARTFRKFLAELDAYTFEKAAVRMLHGHGYRELKVAKRNNLGPLITGRKREGSVELRCAVRLVKGNASIDRKQVQDLRRDMGNYGAQLGLLLSPGDPRGDARSEATHSGPLALLWCGEALAEKFFDAKAGVTVQTVELYEVDERFFEEAKVEAEETARRREERQRNRPEKPARPPRGEKPAAAAPVEEEELSAEFAAAPAEMGEGASEGEEEEGEESEAEAEGAEGSAQEASAEGGAAAPGEGEHRRRRRRRRRGRRGRGDRPAGAPGEAAASGGEGPSGQGGANGSSGGAESAPSAAPSESRRSESGGESGGGSPSEAPSAPRSEPSAE